MFAFAAHEDVDLRQELQNKTGQERSLVAPKYNKFLGESPGKFGDQLRRKREIDGPGTDTQNIWL